jgi:hypothetical protein
VSSKPENKRPVTDIVQYEKVIIVRHTTDFLPDSLSGSILIQLLVKLLFVCVDVMYSGEYDVCDVTLSVHPHLAS